MNCSIRYMPTASPSLPHLWRWSLLGLLASAGVLSMFAASILLARESTLAVTAINEEMDHRPQRHKPG